MRDSDFVSKIVIPVLSLIVAVISSVSSFHAVKVSQEQSAIAAEQFEQSKPRLKIVAYPGKVFPVDGQEDGYQIRYRGSVYVSLINESSLPITITKFELINSNKDLVGWSTPHLENKDNYILHRRELSASSYNDEVLPLTNGKQIKPIVVLPAYEAKTGFVLFLINPDIKNIDLNLILGVSTSRGTFTENVLVSLKPGLTNEY